MTNSPAPVPVPHEAAAEAIAENNAKADAKARADRIEKAPKADKIRMKVLKAGDGRISTGDHVAGQGDKFYAKDDTFDAPLDVATALEDRGFAAPV